MKAVFCGFCIVLFQGNAFAKETFDQSLQQTRDAYQLFVQGKNLEAYEMVLKAYASGQNDEMLVRSQALLAQRLYGVFGDEFFQLEKDCSYTFGLRAKKNPSGKIFFLLDASFLLPVGRNIAQVYALTPYGEKISIFPDGDGAQLSQYPTDDRKSVITLARSEASTNRLGSGLYQFHLTFKEAPKSKVISLFLWTPAESSHYPELNQAADETKVHWTRPESVLPFEVLYRGSNIYGYKAQGLVPIFNKKIDVPGKSLGGEVEISSETSRMMIEFIEVVRRGQLGLNYYYQWEWERP